MGSTDGWSRGDALYIGTIVVLSVGFATGATLVAVKPLFVRGTPTDVVAGWAFCGVLIVVIAALLVTVAYRLRFKS
jgi:hypothetical protein